MKSPKKQQKTNWEIQQGKNEEKMKNFSWYENRG